MESRAFIIGTTLADNPVPRHFVGLAQTLCDRGHRVVVIAPHRKVELESPEANPAIFTWPSERPTRPRDAMFFQRMLERYRPSCLISNFSAVNLMTILGGCARVPVRLAWYHTVAGQLMQDGSVSFWKRQLLTLRKRVVYRAATHVIANSQASALDVQQVYRVPQYKCRVFHNALADPFHEDACREPVVAGRLVCVGRLAPSKGQDVLIRALALIQKKHPLAQIDFVGEGPQAWALQQLAQRLEVADRCNFCGRAPHREVLRRMAGAVVTIVPSRHEAFGLVNIESMAVGTPVIASAVGGIIEIVRDGLDGFLVPPDNVECLAAKLDCVLSNSQLRDKMGERARQRFLERFEIRRAVSEQADWLESLVDSRLRADF